MYQIKQYKIENLRPQQILVLHYALASKLASIYLDSTQNKRQATKLGSRTNFDSLSGFWSVIHTNIRSPLYKWYQLFLNIRQQTTGSSLLKFSITKSLTFLSFKHCLYWNEMPNSPAGQLRKKNYWKTLLSKRFVKLEEKSKKTNGIASPLNYL